MTGPSLPSLDEVVLGAFLEDIGKFMQRAHGGTAELPQEVLNRASVVLPGFQGRSSHWHALCSDAFFHELERRGVTLPGGMNLDRVRDAAVFHHRPATPLHWLSAEADRLSAGMDRKKKDEAAEENTAPAGRDAFRRTALSSIFNGITLGRQPAVRRAAGYRVTELSPSALRPGPVDGQDQVAGYAALWPAFVEGFVALCRDAPNLALFHEGLLSLSERFTWAIPSSTVDQPDVPLHDHDKSVAAVAACLYRFHAARDELADERAIRDREVPKYHFLVGDLSGIQSTLFRLASQQVKGAVRILRARSFLMAAMVEAVSLAARRKLDLPPYCELLAAGGRFQILVPATDDVADRVAGLRGELERWLADQYLGELGFNLALGRPLSGNDLMQGRFGDSQADANLALAVAKQAPFSTQATGVLKVAYDEGPDGACAACGVRPATRTDGQTRRCSACHDAHEIGQRLPRARAVLIAEGGLPPALAGGAAVAAMPCGMQLAIVTDDIRGDDRDAWRRVLSGYRLPAARDLAVPPAMRHVANHVPRFGEGEEGADRYRNLGEAAKEVGADGLKTFAHLAADALEQDGQGGLRGRAMLAVLKADVDRLGQIMSRGLGRDLSLGRLATLSRLTDAFFTIVLPDLLRRDFPDTYTVYAGGDDLLLLGPWLDMVRLAQAIAEGFQAHVAGNPEITLSAGLEFCGAHEPLNRAVDRAEGRLERAKGEGRNKVCLVAEPALDWPVLTAALADAERIDGWMNEKDRSLPTAFVYRSLRVARERDRAAKGELQAANWRGRWAYSVSRNLRGRSDPDQERLRFFDGLLGSGLTTASASPRDATKSDAITALVIALYRNR